MKEKRQTDGELDEQPAGRIDTPSAPASGDVDSITDRVDAALRAFWRGSPQEFDALVQDPHGDDDGVCGLLANVIEPSPMQADLPPQIGDYTILRRIGRGGMAEVFEARQGRTGRTVALKVVRRWEPAGDAYVKLIRREIDTLARLKHPGIATLYDAGQTPEGHHYFAMELVSGRTLAEFANRGAIDQSRLPDLLRLFAQICDAVQYAHQRGVIHCDLKPSNIMVVEDEGTKAQRHEGTKGAEAGNESSLRAYVPTCLSASPKILDFGLARLLDSDAGAVSGITEAGRIMGTLAYMSPEQVSGRREEIDIRSDVYSLGVILYELLTGARPYPAHTSAWAAAARHICETPPRRPGAIARALRGDLEAILLKTLEKDPARRYQSAAGLSDDIRRYLANQPILARPPSAGYQLRKLIARHKLTTTLLAAIFFLATGAAVVLAWQAARLANERDLASAHARRAERVSAFLQQTLSSLDPSSVGSKVLVRDVLDHAAAGLDAELAGDPDVRASLHDTLGRSYYALSVFDEAERHFRAALQLRGNQCGKRHPLYAATLHQLGLAVHRRGDFATADRIVEEAYAIRSETLGEDHPDLAESLHELADRKSSHSDFNTAETYHRRALEIRRRALGDHRDVAASSHRLARLLVDAGRYEEAEPLLRDALGMRRRLLGPNHFDVAWTLTDIGEILVNRNHHSEAEACFREQIRILRGLGHDSYYLANALTDLAVALGHKNDPVQAEPLFIEGIEMQRRVSGADGSIALNVHEYSGFLRQNGRYVEAEPFARESYLIWTGQHEGPHPARAYGANNLATILFELGRIDESERLFREAETIWRTLFGVENAALGGSLVGLSRVAEKRGDLETAIRHCQEALDVFRRRLGEDHPKTSEARARLGQLRAASGSTATRPALP